MPSTYTQNPRSMMKYEYNCVFLVCRKPHEPSRWREEGLVNGIGPARPPRHFRQHSQRPQWLTRPDDGQSTARAGDYGMHNGHGLENGETMHMDLGDYGLNSNSQDVISQDMSTDERARLQREAGIHSSGRAFLDYGNSLINAQTVNSNNFSTGHSGFVGSRQSIQLGPTPHSVGGPSANRRSLLADGSPAGRSQGSSLAGGQTSGWSHGSSLAGGQTSGRGHGSSLAGDQPSGRSQDRAAASGGSPGRSYSSRPATVPDDCDNAGY